jgi:hypothetical protein
MSGAILSLKIFQQIHNEKYSWDFYANIFLNDQKERDFS